jgi:branched-chain amino acid aminotransferase
MDRGTHTHPVDPRNEDILIYLNGELVPRDQARVSVFDSGFCLGDGIWEGIRLHNKRFFALERHLDRLYEGASVLALDIGMSREELTDALYRTVDANRMESGVHVRLMITRGLKKTPSQDPRLNVGGPTVVMIAEHKVPDPKLLEEGIRLMTSHIRRGRPEVQDPRLNSHSKLNCILAMVQALAVGADEALMLDPHGFVSTCNATNFFIVRRGQVWTSTGRYCLHGITREITLELAQEAGVGPREADFSLTEVYSADEAFVTGTFAGMIPVVSVDGRRIGRGNRGKITRDLQLRYKARVEEETQQDP